MVPNISIGGHLGGLSAARPPRSPWTGSPGAGAASRCPVAACVAIGLVAAVAAVRRRRATGLAGSLRGHAGQPAVAVVEIPKGSSNKYEWDDELGAIKLDRLLFSSLGYPTDYGFFSETLAVGRRPARRMIARLASRRSPAA